MVVVVVAKVSVAMLIGDGYGGDGDSGYGGSNGICGGGCERGKEVAYLDYFCYFFFFVHFVISL